MKKIFLVIFVAIIISALNARTNFIAADDIDKLKKASVIVITLFYDSKDNIIAGKIGTGFFIEDPEDCMLVTAFHVVSDFDAPTDTKDMEIAISFGYERNEIVNPKNLKNLTSIYPFSGKYDKYYEVDADYDLIVFNLKNILKKKPTDAISLVKKSKDLPSIGDYVATIGHTEGKIFYNFGEGKVTTLQNQNIITNFPNVSFGNSGGCVVNNDYDCIGLLDAKLTSGALVQFVIPSTYIYPLVLKLQASSKGEEKTLKNYTPSDEYKGQVIIGDPGFILKSK